MEFMKTMKCLKSRKLSISKLFCSVSLLSILLASCSSESESIDENSNSVISTTTPVEESIIIEDTSKKTLVNEESQRYTYQTTNQGENGWGYQLLDSGNIFINQPHIPAVSGNQGFSSEEKAIKCAEYALSKVHEGIIPPTLTKTELDSLGVLD